LKLPNSLNTEQTEFLIDKINTCEFIVEDSTIECRDFSCEHCKLFESECVLSTHDSKEIDFLAKYFPDKLKLTSS